MMIEGSPGMVPPITGPSAMSMRASMKIEGAVSGKCGSVASSGAPPTVRRPCAAKAFDAPPNPGGGTGSKGLRATAAVAGGRGRSGKSCENSGRPITGALGESGRMSRSRSGDSASDSRARSVSIAALSVNWSANSFWTAIESAGIHGEMSGENSRNSGAPRPSACACTTLSQALTPSE